jgi:hypothetical protein
VTYYIIDNEPDLWSATHTDVHPVQMGYDDVLSTFLTYAEAIKNVDPLARVAGPALSGWTAYFYSARDAGADRYRTHADRQAHGDMEFLPWWLNEVRKHDESTGRRSLDVLDVHYYPQAANVFGAADDPATAELRVRSTRALWDATYVDESWIAEPVRLIPRLHEWVDRYYPGTRIAIGEWNWGGEQSMSGALAVADVLGIFGREGVDMASYWTAPPLGSPTAQAFGMYTNADGQFHTFGDSTVAARSDASPNYLTVYASIDVASDDLSLVVLNKQSRDVSASINLGASIGARAELLLLRPGAAGPRRLPDVPIAGGDLLLQLPGTSIAFIYVAREQA